MQSTGHGASPSSVRGWNEYAVVSSLREGPKRVSSLAAATRLTPAALGEVLRGLRDKGWVDVSAPVRSGRGRPAQLYALTVPTGCVLGLDLGLHSTRAIALDLWGNELARAEARTPADAPLEERRRVAADVLDRVLAGAGGLPVWLTVLAVGGSLDETGRVRTSVALPEWEGHHPSDLFGALLPSRSVVVNDVRAATWAERMVGAAKEHAEILLVHLGRRPTLGLLMGNSPRRGFNGMAGDMSLSKLLPIEEDLAWLAQFAGEDPLGDGVRAALAGDGAALAGAVAHVESVTPAIAFASSIVDPAMVVIAGPLVPLAEHFLPDLDRAIGEDTHHPPAVAVSALDQYAAALGAALLGLRRLADVLASPTAGVSPLTIEEAERLLAAAPPSEVDQLQAVPSFGTTPSS